MHLPQRPAKRGSELYSYNKSVEFALRDFRPEEFETLWRIDQQCFAPGISYTREELSTYLQRPHAFAVVAHSPAMVETVSKGRISNPGHTRDEGGFGILGFIVAEAASRGTGHIITIDVLPSARGAGIGSQMLRLAEERLRDARCRSVLLETAVDNHSALAFYKRHGYMVIKSLPGYYSNGVDAIGLKKDLLSPSEPAKLPQ